MKLPEPIESAVRAIEADWAARGGQQAGTPRARELRTAIEAELARLTAERDTLRQERHRLLILMDECRDAIQPITTVQMRLHNISPTLARRIDAVINEANERNRMDAAPAVPEAGSPAEDDARLIERLLEYAASFDTIGFNDMCDGFDLSGSMVVKDLRAAAARLRARPQQEEK